MDGKHIKRRLLLDLKAHLDSKEMSLVAGPRQAGKTTLISELRNDLARSGEKTLFFSMDIEEDKKFFISQNALLNRIQIEFGGNRGFVFLDEIQRKEDAGLFLKGLYDRGLPYKFVVSGSGSLELKEKVHESLAGRKRIFELPTVTFEEFADFRTEYRYEGRLRDFFSVDTEAARRFLDEYLVFGGYPRVILAETREEKMKIINEIYRSVVERDISYLLKVEKVDAFSSMLRLLSAQNGGILNYSDIAQAVDVSAATLKNYLWYAEKTFLVERVRPFFRNARKEITKSPVLYFHDTGLRNYIAGMFGEPRNPEEKSFLFQNAVWRALRESIGYRNANIRFWRTKERAEVDFIIETPKEAIPVEVKYREMKRGEIKRSLQSFIEKYSPSKAFVVNRSYEGTEEINETEVRFLPFWKAGDIVEGNVGR